MILIPLILVFAWCLSVSDKEIEMYKNKFYD